MGRGRLRITLVLCALSLALAACSDPRSTKLPADLASMESIKPQMDKLKDDERKLLAGYIARRTFGGLFGNAATPAQDITIGQAIDDQRRFVVEAEAKEAAAKAEADRKAAAKAIATTAMQQAVRVALDAKRIDVERGYGGMEMDRLLQVGFSFTNHSAKEIAGVKGMITAVDLFGDPISRFAISTTDSIAPGATMEWRGSRSVKFAYGPNKDAKFAELDPAKFTIKWEPEMIVFADGSKLLAE